MITKCAVKWLTWRLREDPQFWMAYQANIAMTIYNNFKKFFPLIMEKSLPSSLTLQEFCNICANDFLKLWTRPR